MRLCFLLSSIVVLASSAGCGSDEAADTSSSATSAASTSTAGSGGAGGEGGATTSVSAGGAGGVGGGGGSAGAGGGGVDLDADGLDDAFEEAIAKSYRPFLSVDPDDGCKLGGIVYRVRPHPSDPSKILVLYDHLFQNDCGLGGHVGDNEAFGVLIDPAVPPPAGILAIKAIGHQGTFCEKVTECGSCGGLPACTTADLGGQPTPVVFSSSDKHASYVEEGECAPLASCFDSCTLAPSSDDPPMVNAGEPRAHLANDLTDQGFIRPENGWTERSLFHYGPWDPVADFGGAGNVSEDLDDPAFVPAPCP